MWDLQAETGEAHEVVGEIIKQAHEFPLVTLGAALQSSMLEPTLKQYIRKPSSKPSKNLATGSSNMSVQALPALGAAAGEDNWCQKVVGDRVATIHGARACTEDVLGTEGMFSNCPIMAAILV